nr:hypothetical protein [Tanacetum cinerariifolium]
MKTNPCGLIKRKIQKIDRLARSLLIQGLPNDIYSLIHSNKTAKDLWDALARHMIGSEYGEQDRKAAVLYECETFKATKGELLLDTYIRYLQYSTMMRQNKNLMDINIDALYNILKQNQGDVNDDTGLKKKIVVDTFDPLALVAEKTKKITALLAKAFNRRKFYSKPTNNNLRTSSTSQSANKKQEFVKTDDKKVEKKDDEKKRDMSKVKCYNCKKEGHFSKDCKKVKTKMLLAMKDKDEQVLWAEDQAWMESSSDSDQEINANMVFMAQIDKVLSDSETRSSSTDDEISDVSYYLSESEYETSEYYDNTTTYAPHQDQSSFNQNYLQQPMPNPEDITGPTTAMNMALALMAKAFKLNYSTPTNNNQRISSKGMNMGQDRQMQTIGGNGGNQFRQYAGNPAGWAKWKPDKTQLLIAQKEEAEIQLQAEEYDLMAAAADLDEIEEVNANYILMANLQQASTSGTQSDSAPIYDTDGSAE